MFDTNSQLELPTSSTDVVADKVRLNYAFIKSIFAKKLSIPDYQRPYRWRSEHVLQLLEDIQRNLKNAGSYRIGTIILHRHSGSYDIVDGQQRMVTLNLILHYLYSQTRDMNSNEVRSNCGLPLLSSSFPHSDSQVNIAQNYKTIKEWFKRINGSDHKEFERFILQKCELVEIILDDLSEAFQLFDSQNARGKALEPYDLLKAFHLREMAEEVEEEKKKCVKSWEEAVNKGMLNNLGKYIFRIRKWARGGKPGEFSKADIAEFKGISINDAVSYPYMKSILMNDVLLNSMSGNSLYKIMGVDTDFPFRLTQPIVNGRMFFKMIEHYNKRYTRLFEDDNFIKTFYQEYCKYNGHHRIGDRYVSELFKALLLFYDDKYGKEDLQEVVFVFYKWAYRLRLTQKRVFYSSIDKHVSEDNLFKKVELSYYPKQIKSFNVSINVNEIKLDISKIRSCF